MSVAFIAVPVTLLIAAMFVGAFVWSVRKGQFDDLTTPALRILFDDEEAAQPPAESDARSDRGVRGGASAAPSARQACDPRRAGRT